MESDPFFYRFFKQLPETFFELLALPSKRARAYRFDAVELKKAYRIDGLFAPRKAGQPLYFVEVQFRKVPAFYANLFAKVFAYLEENDPSQEWMAVAIFPSRKMEPDERGPYEALLQSSQVRRIYLNEIALPSHPPVGLGILRLLSAPIEEVGQQFVQLRQQAKIDFADGVKEAKAIELAEELLLQRFSELSLEEVRTMFDLDDFRKTRLGKGIHEEGIEEGMTQAKKDWVGKMLAKGMSAKEIAELLDVTASEVRRLAKEDDTK